VEADDFKLALASATTPIALSYAIISLIQLFRHRCRSELPLCS
jgi:hypothetical protein